MLSYSNTNHIQLSLAFLTTHLISMDARMWLLPLRILKKFLLKLVRLGGSIVNPPAVSANGSVKVMYCHDLDGILMEMVEELQ